MSTVQYYPLDTKFKSIIGAIDKERQFSLSIYVSCQFDNVTLNVSHDCLPLNYEIKLTNTGSTQQYNIYTAELSFSVSGIYWYYFTLTNDKGKCYVVRDGVDSRISDNIDSKWQLSIINKKYNNPQWLSGGIMYHIFVDRFCKSEDTYKLKKDVIFRNNWGDLPSHIVSGQNKIITNDFFGGTLKGIESKLNYLKQLNVTVIYLSPIFDAASNHKYDTADFENVDSMFGTNEQFKILCDKALELGIRVILDGVFNHTGSDSKYFNKYGNFSELGAYQSMNSQYYDWFKFTKYPYKYDCWWDFNTLPALNQHNNDVKQYFAGENGIVSKWLKLGASGWRLDVADELTPEFLDLIRFRAKETKSDCLIIGEVWDDAANKIAYGKRRGYFTEDQLDSAMNYPLSKAIIQYVKFGDCKQLRITIFDMLNNMSAQVVSQYMNILSTHDTARILTTLNGDTMEYVDKQYRYSSKMTKSQYDHAVKMLMVASVLQYTLCGVPCIFYGDEAGIEGCQDPFCRKCFPWGNEDKQLLSHYKRLGQIRSSGKVFASSNFCELIAQDGKYAFRRWDSDESYIIVANTSLNEAVFNQFKGIDQLTGNYVNNNLILEPMQAVIIKE